MDEIVNIKESLDLLKRFKEKLTFNEVKVPTFLEILKQSNKEVLWSNILVFYFNPNKEHLLKDLLLRSLFEALGKNQEINNFKSIGVEPEIQTNKHKRIDIVITAEDFVIGIENKVDYWLNNPLEDYANKIDEIANDRKPYREPYKVILSKFPFRGEHNFENITYEYFVKKIENNLPDYEAEADKNYLIFLKDFLKNIKNTIKFKEMIENTTALDFFTKYFDDVEKLTSRFGQFQDEITQKFGEIYQAIELKEPKIAIKQKFGEIADVSKDRDEDLTCWIFIGTGKRLIIVEIAMYGAMLCCYSRPGDPLNPSNGSGDEYAQIIDNTLISTELKKLEGLKISDDTNTTVKKIVSYTNDIIEQVLEKIEQ